MSDDHFTSRLLELLEVRNALTEAHYCNLSSSFYTGFFGALTPPVGMGNWTGTCIACTPIQNAANNLIQCTSASDSKARTGFQCNTGYSLLPAQSAGALNDTCVDNGCPDFASGNPANCACDAGNAKHAYSVIGLSLLGSGVPASEREVKEKSEKTMGAPERGGKKDG